LIDLDGFKFVNDTRGHPFGDKLLTAVAGRLSANLRNIDKVARCKRRSKNPSVKRPNRSVAPE
jgi:diguanylate cyclase (GGDEF)-like protein